MGQGREHEGTVRKAGVTPMRTNGLIAWGGPSPQPQAAMHESHLVLKL